MTAVVLRGDARSLPLPDASVDLVVTSPPYFGLRSYTDAGEHYGGQIGSEETPREWLGALLDCTREWMRVLKPSGSIFVNLGDKYAAGHGGSSTERNGGYGANLTVQRDRPAAEHWAGAGSHPSKSRAVVVPGTRPKSLLGLPWRYALGCMDDLGLILRAEVVWSKPNGLPESVTDRVRRAHEQVFHFTQRPRYYAAVDEIREDYSDRVIERQRYTGRNAAARIYAPQNRNDADRARGILGFGADGANPLGKLPGSVWDIPSQPLAVPARLGIDHFAAFPMELPRRCILGWSPPSGVVLDPFGGTGTTALVAAMHGRHGVSVDRSADYCRLARWRTTDPGEHARALGVPKPPPVIPGQLDLLTGEAS